MRRWMRVLLVGVLSLLLSIDSASACRFLRNRCRPRSRTVTCHRVQPRVTHCHPSACETTAACSPCFVPSAETIVIETTQCCVPADGSAHAEIVESVSQPSVAPTVAAEEPLAPQTAVVVEEPAPTQTTVAAEKPTPAPVTPAPVEEPLPPLEPAVAPASAEQPVAQPQFKTAKEILAEAEAKKQAEAEQAARLAAEKPAVETPAEKPLAAEEAVTEEPVTKPQAEPATEEPAPEEPSEEEPAAKEPAPKKLADEEENLFDETDDETDSKPAAVPAAEKEESPAKEAAPAQDLFGETEAAEKPAAEEAATEEPADEPAEEPAAEEPAAEKEEAEEPKAEDDPFAGILRAPNEPVRRWIDNTGLHETVGRLVEVHPDRIRILKANGHHANVPLERLSRHDQAYVSSTGERIAAEQRARPATTDTASR